MSTTTPAPTGTTITVPMAGIGETWALPNVPDHLATMVSDIAESGVLCYGPTYSRQAAEAVRDASRFLGWGDVEAAERYLLAAWSRATR